MIAKGILDGTDWKRRLATRSVMIHKSVAVLILAHTKHSAHNHLTSEALLGSNSGVSRNRVQTSSPSVRPPTNNGKTMHAIAICNWHADTFERIRAYRDTVSNLILDAIWLQNLIRIC